MPRRRTGTGGPLALTKVWTMQRCETSPLPWEEGGGHAPPGLSPPKGSYACI